MRLAIITGLGALALTGCAANSEVQQSQQARADRELADAIKDRVPGEPTDCVSNMSLDGPQIIDRNTILYRDGGRIWRNELGSECPGLSPFDTIVLEVHGSQICRNDRFRTIDPGSRIPGPYCLLGKFTPYTKK